MWKTQSDGVQRRTIESCQRVARLLIERLRGDRANPSICLVADERVPQMRQMCANLMRAASFQPAFKQRYGGPRNGTGSLVDPEARNCGAPTSRQNRHARALGGMNPDIQLNSNPAPRLKTDTLEIRDSWI